MTLWSWEQNVSCCTGAIREGNERPELFARSWQGRLWAVYWRVPIFIWALATIIWSAASFWGTIDKFLLYMTHWGLLLILIESFFGIIVAVKEYDGLPDVKAAFPWYLKVFWLLYNITIPVAFLVTIFYWSILNAHGKKINYAPNPVLDVMLHGVNSVVMLVELILSAHPSRLLHIMQPLYFALVYLIFTAIYYGAGGLDPWGHVFIYPVIDWSKPEQTLVVAVLTGLLLTLMHLVTVAIAAVRDLIAKRCIDTSPGIYNDGFDA
ncbi:protein rolling stone-like isoform X2 [Battus philenor]|uniref:protein rolling stone-like isoform X2 n=1 Tax=Battus philenor TaxID=42288 RepID=UPI0035CEE7EF